MAHEHAAPGVVVDLNTFGGSKSTAVVKEKTFEVIRIAVEAGKPIPPHKVDGPITVQCLSGKCTFFVGEEPRQLVPGSWLYLTGGTMHALASDEDATLLLSIVFQRNS